MNRFRTATLMLALVTTGLAAGFFYAYACSVSLGLGRLGDAEYVAAMQAINDTVRNAAFALSFFGALVALAVALAAHRRVWRSRVGALVAVAFLAYAVGAFALTLGVSVPLNEELARVPADAGATRMAEARASYEDDWNLWNSVRTGFATLALAATAGALALGRRDDSGV